MTLSFGGGAGVLTIPGLTADGQTPGGIVVTGGIDVNDNTNPSNGSYFGGFTQFFDTDGTIGAHQDLVLISEALAVPNAAHQQKGALTVVRQGDISAADYPEDTVRIVDSTASARAALTVSKPSGTGAALAVYAGKVAIQDDVTLNSSLGVWGHTPPATQVVLATGAAHTVDDVITLLQSYGLCKQS